MHRLAAIIVSILLFTGCTTLRVKNDILSDTDEDFTHGTEFVYQASASDAPNFIKAVGSVLPDLTLGESKPPTHYEMTVGQHIYTPGDLKESEVILEDNPYAGWLFGEVRRQVIDGDVKRETGLTLGITGKYSGAEMAQKFVHIDLDKGTDPMGWDNQIGTEVGLIGSYGREEITGKYTLGPLEVHSMSGTEVRLGNIHTDATYGREFRVGHNLPQFDVYHSDWSVYGYAGGNFSAVARNIFYDGNTFKDSHSVGSQPAVGRLESGAVIQILGWELGLNYVFTTPEHKERKSGHSVWMVTISKALQELFNY